MATLPEAMLQRAGGQGVCQPSAIIPKDPQQQQWADSDIQTVKEPSFRDPIAVSRVRLLLGVTFLMAMDGRTMPNSLKLQHAGRANVRERLQ
jgi:hypothetical protein